jgi:hypothetical protein
MAKKKEKDGQRNDLIEHILQERAKKKRKLRIKFKTTAKFLLTKC